MTSAAAFLRRVDRALLLPVARGYRRLTRDRRRPRALTVVALAIGVTAIVAAVWQANQPPPGSDTTVGQVVRVGVGQGGSIPGYVSASRAELAALPATAGQTYALVSLSAYLAPERLSALIGDVGVISVYVRVPLDRGQTEIVRVPVTSLPADVLSGMDQLAERKNREAATYRDQLASTTETELAAVYADGARIAAAEAVAYADHCSCAYAAVVRGTPDRLRELETRTGIRAVDPAPEIRSIDRAVFLPPLPEQRDRVTPP
jgi:hypothetical protein